MKYTITLAFFILTTIRDGYSFSVQLEKLSALYLPYDYTPTPQYALLKGATEQLAYDAEGRLIYSVGKNLDRMFKISNVVS